MPEIILGRNIRVRVTPKGKYILDAFAPQDSGKLVDLIPVIMQACKVDHRLDLVVVLDLLCKLYRTVAVGRSAGAERNTYEVRLKLCQHFKSLVNIVELGVLLRREDLKRETSFLLVNL